MHYDLDQKKKIIQEYKRYMPYTKHSFDRSTINDDEVIDNMLHTINQYKQKRIKLVDNHLSNDDIKSIIFTILFMLILFWFVINFCLVFITLFPSNSSLVVVVMFLLKICILWSFNFFSFVLYVKDYEKSKITLSKSLFSLITLFLVDYALYTMA